MSREMKYSGVAWIGDIPNQWKVVRHKNVMHKQKDIQEIYHEQDIISLTMGGVIVRDLNAGGKMPTSFDGYQHVYPNDLLLCLFDIDVTPRCVGLVKNAGVTSPAYSRFITHDNAYAPYYDYLLRYIDDYKCFLHLSKNLRSSLTETDFGVIYTCLPPLVEQKAIADFLDKKCNEIDELVALQEKMIEELKAYKQSAITEAVCKGLNPNVPMKDSGIKWVGDIPEGWSVDRLKSIGKLYGGLSGKSGDDFNVNEEDTYALYIPFTNIFNNNVIDLNKLYKVKVVEGEIQNEVSKGDILFLMSSEDYEGLGKSCLMNDSVPSLYLNSFCKGLRITAENIHSPYINYMLLSTPMRHMIMSMGNGFIRINLRAEKLITLPILLPTFTEQQEIADYLDKKCNGIDQLISIKQQKIVELKDYKKSLIYEYTTGKKEVKL